MSTVSFKALADVVFGDNPKPDWFQGRYTPLTPEVVPCLQSGTVIFVENEYLGPFFSTVGGRAGRAGARGSGWHSKSKAWGCRPRSSCWGVLCRCTI